MPVKYKEPRTPREAQADYAKRRARSAALAPGLNMPYPARELTDYTKLTPLVLPVGSGGPLTLKPRKPRPSRT